MKLQCEPIGYIRTGKRLKFDTPHQPKMGREERNIIELLPGHRYEIGLRDLAGFQMVWLIWWFHRHDSWRPLVMPPRGPSVRRGVFATRSPHRPNPIGLTAVPLLEVGSNFIVVGNVDLLEGTPILDIKPYLSEVDAFTDQKSGWLEEELHLFEQPPLFKILIQPNVEERCSWLERTWGVTFLPKVCQVLERRPEKSRTYRITGQKAGVSRISSGGWRIYFSVSADTVTLHNVASGYPKQLLYEDGYTVIPDWEAQRSFYERFGGD